MYKLHVLIVSALNKRTLIFASIPIPIPILIPIPRGKKR